MARHKANLLPLNLSSRAFRRREEQKISTPGSTVLIFRQSAREGRCASKNLCQFLGVPTDCQNHIKQSNSHCCPYPEVLELPRLAHLVPSFVLELRGRTVLTTRSCACSVSNKIKALLKSLICDRGLRLWMSAGECADIAMQLKELWA